MNSDLLSIILRTNSESSVSHYPQRPVGQARHAVAETIRLMPDNHISGLPVMNEARRLVGILTKRDLSRRSEAGTERHRPRWLELLVGPERMAGEYASRPGRAADGTPSHQTGAGARR
jgi:CBS-domain-containing membrane protein